MCNKIALIFIVLVLLWVTGFGTLGRALVLR
jgi:hypothetical protein